MVAPASHTLSTNIKWKQLDRAVRHRHCSKQAQNDRHRCCGACVMQGHLSGSGTRTGPQLLEERIVAVTAGTPWLGSWAALVHCAF